METIADKERVIGRIIWKHNRAQKKELVSEKEDITQLSKQLKINK